MSASIIEHVPARAAAEAYQKSAEEIREALATISGAVERIRKAFAADSKYEFNISVDIGRSAYYVTEPETVEMLMADMKRQAWCVLVDCCKNGNLHLEFKRKDLLDRFNLIAGRNRLPQRDSVTGKAK